MLNTTNLIEVFSIHRYDNCTKTEIVRTVDTLNALQISHEYYLTDLQPVTEYCVSISSGNPWGTSNNSSTICNTTTGNGISGMLVVEYWVL